MRGEIQRIFKNYHAYTYLIELKRESNIFEDKWQEYVFLTRIIIFDFVEGSK